MDEVSELRKTLTELDREKKAIMEIWSGIDINNSWETLLVHAPASISALGKLMVLSVTSPSQVTPSLGSTYSYSEFTRTDENTNNLKANLVQAVNEGRSAHETGHQSMALISQNMNEIPAAIHKILGLLEQKSSEKIRLELPGAVKHLRGIVEESAASSYSLTEHIQHADDLLSANNGSSAIGRSGFMLLGEVKQFWSALISFCDEMSKLIEYTLDSSCNALVAILMTQFDVASKSPKYSLKSKHREEIYRLSLSTVAYALSVRHLAEAYLRYSRQFILPQLTSIARYPLIAHSEVEMLKVQQQFKDHNAACKREMNRILQTNKIGQRRRSILELDMGLHLHLSDIAADLDKFLTPIAEFRKRKSSSKGVSSPVASPVSSPEESPTKEKMSMFGRIKSSIGRRTTTDSLS